MNIKYFLSVFILTISLSAFSQDDINQLDSQGNRHGAWMKMYEGSTQMRYKGEFNHGKEIGVFNYYCKDCKDRPIIIKTFNERDNTALVVFLTKKGKVVSEGIMEGKNRIGEWFYYHETTKNVMTREFYIDGNLDGKKITYYLNQKITEEVTYKNGVKDGLNNYYAPDGVLLKKLIYKNDQLEGKAFYYDSNGDIIIDGNYKNGRKDGIWKYYSEGIFLKEETFPKS